MKVIHVVCVDAADGLATTGELARRLGLTPGTVSGMLTRLGDAGLVEHRRHQGVRLTERGRRLALCIMRRHRLMELFLAKTLGMSIDEVHAEAENLEHAASDRLIDLIDQHLGFPDRDPHGDPIPDASGRLRAAAGEPLVNCPAGTRFTLVRVPDRSAALLRYLAEAGLQPGDEGEVLANVAEAGVLSLQTSRGPLSLGRDAARELLVERYRP